MRGSLDVGAVIERVAAVRSRIESAGGEAVSVRLVAVTKGFGPEAVAAAVAAGVEDVGENYAQELVAKAADAPPGARWHFVGRLQSNKVRLVADVVALWQSVDRASLVPTLAARAPGAHVLVQVDVTGRPERGGCAPAEAADLVAALRGAGLVVEGLMAVGPGGPPEDARPGFRLLATLADELDVVERSMGMSGDLEVAVEEGATIVRIGRDLFGERPPRPPTSERPPAMPMGTR